MRSSKWIPESHFSLASPEGPTARRGGQPGNKPAGTKVHRAVPLGLATVALLAMPVLARSQSILSSGDSLATSAITSSANLDLTYVPPTERTKVSNYAFDAFGPYPIAGAGVAAGGGGRQAGTDAGESAKRDAQEAFSAGVFAAAKFFDNNFSFDYSGPWAPHNFVDLDLEQ